MAKLWKKNGGQDHPVVERYTVGTDYIFDLELMPFDIEASRAHAKGLQKAGILSADELNKLEQGLAMLVKDFSEGIIGIDFSDEDCHTVIENYLTEKIGEVGKKIHTGRSRNDQVLVAVRLFMRSKLKEIFESGLVLVGLLLDSAKKYQNIPMPGYSHTQQAMLSSVGHYYTAYAESLIDDLEFLKSVYKQIDKNPLGSAAGFGTSIPIDREFTTQELGFSQLQLNSLYCQNSRGKFESLYMEGLSQVMMSLGKIANDLIIFTSQEFEFFQVDESLTTGSSIMPQKRNLDPLEILRGNVSVILANQMMIKEIAKNLLSGYNRELQLLKKPLFESVQIVKDSLEIISLVVKGTQPRPEKIETKITRGIFAADVANKLVQEQGVPFRDAYKQAMDLLSSQKIDFQENIKSKVTLGSAGNLAVDLLTERLKVLKNTQI